MGLGTPSGRDYACTETITSQSMNRSTSSGIRFDSMRTMVSPSTHTHMAQGLHGTLRN